MHSEQQEVYARWIHTQLVQVHAELSQQLAPQHPSVLQLQAIVEKMDEIVRDLGDMMAEDPQRYDLKALHVEANVGIDSETGFEDRG